MSGNRNSGFRPWWNLEPCGTAAAYKRHVRRGEPKDQACKDAHATEERFRWRAAQERKAREQEEAAV